MYKLLVFSFFILGSSSCAAQHKITEHVYKIEDGKSESARIEDFSILEGDWAGTGLGGQCDELWLPAMADQMHGIFRMEQEGNLIFTEYMTVLEDSISFVMKVKHFSPEFDGWEKSDEAVDFRFIKKENNTLYFSGLTVTRKDENNLNIYVAMKQDDGSVTEELFEFKKK